jgi:hypothetical protein
MRLISEHPNLLLFGVPLALFLGMLVMLEIGRRAGIRRMEQDPGGAKERLGTVEGAIFGLLGLLIAFTFSGAAGRFDKRREMVVQEANQLGDAWARLDALPEATQPAIKAAMVRYLESRLETYRRVPDMKAVEEELARSAWIQDEIWKAAVAACELPEGQRVTMLVLPALDSAFDWSLVRTATAMHHPPGIIWTMLVVLAMSSALIAGYGMTGGRGRNWTYMVGFAAVTAIAVYTILDIEFPRVGLVRVDAADKLLTDLLETMKKG